jgi:hypothetical protein
MATRVTLELTAEERHNLVLSLLPEVISELETALFALQERSTDGDATKAAIRETLLEVVWEIEQRSVDPDEGLPISAETEARLKRVKSERKISLDEVKRNLND